MAVLDPSKHTHLIFSSEELRHQYALADHYKPVVCGITVNDIFRGTGFLIGGNLLMTASHVISVQTAKDNTCLAVFYYITSQTIDKSSTDTKERIIKLDPSRYFYSQPAPPDDQPPDSQHLDFTIVALASHDYLSEVQDRCFSLFEAVKPTDGGLAFICQCPPINDSTDRKENLSKLAIGKVQKQERYSFLYDAETIGGSSGGAVINSNGELIGLHNGTVGLKRFDLKHPWCNEGVLMVEIVERLTDSKAEIEKLIEDYRNKHPNNSEASTNIEPGIIDLKKKHPDFISRQNPISKQNYFDDLSKVFLQSLPIQRPVVVLWGDGGVGKSEIAIAFGNDYAKNFYFIHLIVWDDDQTTPEDGYRALGKKLNILQGEEDPKEIRVKVHSHLEGMQVPKPWLLIFDNVENPAELPLPQRGNGAIIITSRQKDSQDWFTNIEVKNFTEAESLDLLQSIIKKPTTEIRRKLVQELAFVPLLVNQAAHFIKEEDQVSEETYLEWMNTTDNNKIIVFESVFESLPKNLRYCRSLLASWKITFDTLSRKDPEALNWLQFCSYLYPEAIPKHWIEKRLSHYTNKTKRSIKAVGIQTILSSNYALMGYDKKSSSMSMHRYKQAAIQYILESEAIALKMQDDVLLFLENEAKKWLNLDEIIITLTPLEEFFAWGPNASWFLKRFSQKLPHRDKSVTRIKEALANYQHFLGDYEAAETNYEENFSKNKELFGEKSVEVALTLSNLGINAYKTGDFEKATTKLKLALEIRQSSSGDQRGEMADIKSTLGQILHRKGQGLYRERKILDANKEYEEAKKLFQEAQKMKEEKLGREHRSVARAIHCLGRIAYEQKEYDEAEKLLNQALTIREKSYTNKKHTELAHNKNDLGFVLYKKRKYEEAKDIFLKVLGMRKELYGEGHPEIGVTLMNLGQIYNKQGQCQEAKSHLQQSCDILEKSGHRLITIAKHKLQKILLVQAAQIARDRLKSICFSSSNK